MTVTHKIQFPFLRFTQFFFARSYPPHTIPCHAVPQQLRDGISSFHYLSKTNTCHGECERSCSEAKIPQNCGTTISTSFTSSRIKTRHCEE